MMRRMMTFLCMFLVIANLSLPLALAQGDQREYEPQPTRQAQAAGAVLGVIGLAASLAGLAMGAASALDGDNVEIGDIDLSLDNPANFHVGDYRTLIVKAPVSHGNIDGSEKGSIKVCVSGPGIVSGVASCQTKKVTGTSVNGEGRQTYKLKYWVEGVNDWTETIKVDVKVTGENHGFFYDDVASKSKTEELSIAVLDPFPEPWLVPDTMLFDHGGFGLHSLKIKNYSEKGAEAYRAKVNSKTKKEIKIKKGDDNGVTTTLVADAKVPHAGAGHPGQQVLVPFTWEVIILRIFLRYQGWSWFDDNTSGNATDNCWDPNGANDGEDVPDSEESDEDRHSSSGSRDTGHHQSSSRDVDVPLGGIPVSIIDTETGESYTLYTDEEGVFSWEAITLGPTLDLILNPERAIPHFQEVHMPDIPLSLFEGHPEVEIYTAFHEAPAPAITGSFTTSDGNTMRVFVYSRQEGYPDHFLGEYSGDFQIEGRGMLEFNAENSLLVLEPVPAFNQTLLTDEPLVIPVDMTQADVDLGDVQFEVLPRSASPLIQFSGEFIDQQSGSGVEGMILEVTPFDPAQPLVTAMTDAAGHFSMLAPNGWATVSSPNAFELIDGVEPDVSQDIDFGANGFDTLEIQRVVNTQASTCPADVNGDGSVTPADLAILLGSWGPCEQCAADFNGDGVVGAADLAVLLANWGECPDPAVCGDGVVGEGEECDPPDLVSCDENCLFIDPPPCSCGCDLNCDGIVTDEELLECEDLCAPGGICGDGVVDEGEQCDPPDGLTCDDTCQIITGACDYPDIRTIVADAEFDPPDIQQNYDAINATLHMFGGVTFESLFFEPLDLLSAVALERVETLETCAGVPIDAALVAAALQQMMAVGKGLPLVEVISSLPGELEEVKAAMDQLRMQGIGFPPVATTDSDADLLLNSIMVLVDEAGVLEYGDFFFRDSSEVSEAQLFAVTQANDEGGVLDFQVIDVENMTLKCIVRNNHCCNKGVCEPDILDFDRCDVMQDKWCSLPHSPPPANCALCSIGSKKCQ